MPTDRNSEWFDDEAFWDNYAPIMFESDRWAEVPAVCDGIARLSGGLPPADVLDLCSGMGRISLELAARAYRVVGVDITASYLDAAREAAAADGLSIDFIREDARRFVRPAAFDLALNLYTSFGYFGDPSDDLLVCRNVRESLRPGGAFIIETLGKETAVRDFTPGESFERGGFQVTTRYEVIDSWESLGNLWVIEKDGKRIEHRHRQRLYAGTELRSLLLRAGFSGVALYGDWDGSPYDQKARVLIAVARGEPLPSDGFPPRTPPS